MVRYAGEQIFEQSNNVNNLNVFGSILYNVKAYGARGDGVHDDTLAIQAAVTLAAINGGIVFFPAGTYKTGSFTVPANVTLSFSNGAMLSISTGSTVTINGPIDAGMYQIFAGLGTVTGSMKVPIFYPQWWGAKGDGLTDDSTAIRATISVTDANKGIVVFPPGKYNVSGNILVSANVKGFIGIGEVIINAVTQTGGQESISFYNNTDLEVENITFTANNINTINNPLAFVAYNNNATFRKCKFINTGGIGLGISFTTGALITDNYFYNTGYVSLSFPHGSAPAIIVASPPADSTNIKIINNSFKDTNWSGIYFFAQSGLIDGNNFDGCRESTIYAEAAKHIRITNNKIKCGLGVNIANFGIEYGQGFEFVISGNEIEGGQDAAIGITNAQNFVVSDNVCYNSGKLMGAVTYASAGILIREFVNAAVSSSNNGIIKGNICYDDQASKTQRYGFSAFVDTGAVPIKNVVIEGNSFINNLDAPVFIYDETTLYQDTVFFRNNKGYAENSKTIKFDKLSGISGLQTFTGFGFRPKSIRIQGFIDATESWIDIMIVPNNTSAVTEGIMHYTSNTKRAIYLNINDNTGANKVAADWTGGSSTTMDGFKYNYVNCTSNHTLIVTCYP